MPIDTSIYQNLRQPQSDQQNPLDSLTKAMTLGELALKSRQTQQQLGDENDTRAALKAGMGPDGQPNRQAALSALAKTNPTAYMALQARFSQQDAAQAEQKNKVINDHIQQVGLVAHLASSATDQNTYANALDYGQKLGLDISQLPKEWNPQTQAILKRMETAALDQKTRLEAMAKQSEVGINEKKAPLDREHIKAQTENELATAAKTRSETPQKIDLSKVDPSTDPATLVNSVVLPAQRPAVIGDIKDAQVINAMAPKLVAAFKAADTRDPVAHSNAVKVFEGLLNTTIVKLTGTARQAEFDSAKVNWSPGGTFAKPGENKAKLGGFMDFINSQSHYPAAKAAGLDLNKFDSTKPYAESDDLSGLAKDVAKASKGGGGSGGMIESTASADDGGSGKTAPSPAPKPGDVRKGHVFLGGDPSKQESWKRQ